MYTTSETLLIRLKDGGQEQDWRRFVELYSPLLFRWANLHGLQDSDATDLVQEVLVLLIQKLPEFEYDRQGSFRGWLRTVTLNRWRDLLRRRRVEASLETVDESDGGLLADDPGDRFWEVEYRRYLVARALEIMQQSFEPSTWNACWETAVHGRSAAEVGAELGLSEGAVYVAKSRVLKRLRAELEGLWD